MTFENATARTWLEIDEDALIHNLSAAYEALGSARLIAVCKADAYGLGLARVCAVLWEKGVRDFAVAEPEEALRLLSVLPSARVLVMGASAPCYLKTLIEKGARLTLESEKGGREILGAARELKKKAFVHVKLDTGLHRLGFPLDADIDALATLLQDPLIVPEGIYSHLALHNRELDEAQYAGFISMKKRLNERGISFQLSHLCDSIGLARYPDWRMDACRVGAWLYGNAPYIEGNRCVARLKTRVSALRDLKKGDYIGYDDTHPLERDARVATLCAGYADGYPRALSGKGDAMIRDRRARVLGLVCMDQTMVDVTDIPFVSAFDEALLMGGELPLAEIAERAGLNRNECLSNIGRRAPRVYFRGGACVHIEGGFQ